MKYLVLIVVSLFVGCINPFFPRTGSPLTNTFEISEAEDILKGIKYAYENKNLSYFADSLIFSKNDFRYYVEYNPYNPENLSHINRITHIDNITAIPDDDYLYIDFEEEYALHSKMFNVKNEIVFTEPFTVKTVEYPTLSEFPDTVDAIVKSEPTKISIASDVILSVFGKREYEFDIGEQVFILKKTADKKWKIASWIELSD